MPVDGMPGGSTPPAKGATSAVILPAREGAVAMALGFKGSKKTRKLVKIARRSARNRAKDRASATPPANNLG